LWRQIITTMQQAGENPADPANARRIATQYGAQGGTWAAA
jgi:hypothetical protein